MRTIKIIRSTIDEIRPFISLSDPIASKIWMDTGLDFPMVGVMIDISDKITGNETGQANT